MSASDAAPPSSGRPDQTRILQWPTLYGQRPMFGWGLQEALSAVRQHVTGNFSVSGKLAEDMAGHAWIKSALEERMAVETECPTMWTVAGRTRDERRRAQRCADFCREVYPHVLPLHTRHTLHRHRLTMGQSIFAMDWEEVRDGRDRWWLPFVKPWDPTLTSYLYGQGDATTVDGGSYCATTLSHGLVRVVPGDGRWGVFRGRLEKAWLDGIVFSLAAEYVGDGYNFRDNQDHQDRWGRGILAMEYPDSMPQNEIAALLQSANDGGGGGVLPLPQLDEKRGVKAELLRADGAGYQTFDHTETRILRRILVLLCGNDMALVGQTGVAQNDPRVNTIWKKYVADAVATSDCAVASRRDEKTGKRVRVCVPADGPQRQQIWRWVAHYNFGDANLAPYTWLDATELEEYDRQQDAIAGRAQKISSAFSSVATAVKNGLLKDDAQTEWALEQCGLSLNRPPEDGPRRLPGKRRAEGDEGGAGEGGNVGAGTEHGQGAESASGGAADAEGARGRGAARAPKRRRRRAERAAPPTVHSQIALVADRESHLRSDE